MTAPVTSQQFENSIDASRPINPHTVTIVGGGVAGMSAACALAEAGFTVRLLERRGYLGGRASSYLHPGVNEVIDNCQHVLFGCCTNLIGFYRRIGVAGQIRWTSEMTMIEPGGRQSRLGPFQLGPMRLPAPLHGAPSLLSASAFSFADKVALGRAFRAMMRRNAVFDPQESLLSWLNRHGQTAGAINRFWRLVIASALNATLDQIAVPYAAKVIRELFINSAEAGAMGMSTVPLSHLYGAAEQYVSGRGSVVLYNATAESLSFDEERKAWSVHSRGGVLQSQYVILALPFEGLARLLSGLPAAPGRDALQQQIGEHRHWPICSVHLWFDRPITDLNHAVLLDREIHWLYNKSRLQPQSRAGQHYIELVQSASREFAAQPREECIDQALTELGEFFPEAKRAQLTKAALIKEVRATFGVPPGIDAARPHAISPWRNLFLAGDWIQTGWPSTMESAARSGHLAAEAMSAEAGMPLNCLEPDLAPGPLVRFLS